MMDPITGCKGCSGTAGRMGCPQHGWATTGPLTLKPDEPTVRSPGEMIYLYHHHRWVFDGVTEVALPPLLLNERRVLYHCDDHDPPVIRLVPLETTERVP